MGDAYPNQHTALLENDMCNAAVLHALSQVTHLPLQQALPVVWVA
jgi:hypothetical protein